MTGVTTTQDALEAVHRPPVNADQWDARVASLGGNVFHSFSWAQYKSRLTGGTPKFIEFRTARGQELRAIAVGNRTRASRWFLPGLARLEFDAPPACLGAPPGLVSAVAEWARDDPSLVEVRLGSFGNVGGWATDLPPVAQRVEFLVPLSPDTDVLAGMRKSTRYEVRRGVRAGLEVRLARAPADVAHFVRLHSDTLHSLHIRKGVPEPGQGAPRRLTRALEELLTHECGSLFLCESKGTTIAGCFFGEFDRSAYYLLQGGISRDVPATHLLLYTALEHFRNRDYREVNLGGTIAAAADRTSPDHGLYSFKRGFGGSPVQRQSYALVGEHWRARGLRALVAVVHNVSRK